MIKVTRLNGTEYILNADLIETMEETPDTIVTLTNGNKYVVSESIEKIVDMVTELRRRCHPFYTDDQKGRQDI